MAGPGWTELIALSAAYVIAVIRGQAWGRFTGIALAGLSLIANFLFLPYYPLWSILIIALDVAIIWALAVYHDTNPTSQAATPYR